MNLEEEEYAVLLLYYNYIIVLYCTNLLRLPDCDGEAPKVQGATDVLGVAVSSRIR